MHPSIAMHPHAQAHAVTAPVAPMPQPSGGDVMTRRTHIAAMLVAVAVVLLAFALTIRPDGRVAFGLHPQWPVPETCLVHVLFHADCPGCGMTRSIICLARGHWHQSIRYHNMGWVLAVFILLQIPYRAVCLIRGSFPAIRPADVRRLKWLLLVSVMLNWIVQMM
jgi:hypothetical protein